MSITRVQLLTTPLTYKPGDQVLFTIYWEGDQDYNGMVGDRVTITGMGGFADWKRSEFVSGRGQISFYKKVPANWSGDVKGNFGVDHFNSKTNITTSTASTNQLTLKIIPNELNATITLDPSNITMYPGQKTVVNPIITGVEAPYTATWKWTYHLQPQPTFDNKPIEIDYQRANDYEYLLCDVTILKDGFAAKTFRGETKVSYVEGTLEGIGVMLSGLQPDYKVFNQVTMNAMVTGVPAGAEVSYSWLVNGVQSSTTKDLNYKALKAGQHNIQCSVSVRADNYKGTTVVSPEMSVNVSKLTVEDLITSECQSVQLVNFWYPGGASLEYVYWHMYLEDGTGAKLYQNLFGARPVITYRGKTIADIMTDSGDNGKTAKTQNPGKFLPSDIGNYEYEGTFTLPETDVFAGGVVVKKVPGPIRRTPQSVLSGQFVINDKVADIGTIYIQAVPGETITISVANIWSKELLTGDYSQEYKDESFAIGKRGVFQLIDKDGAVAATAVNGVFTYTTPAGEYKNLNGKIRHTLADGTIFSQDDGTYFYEKALTITLVSNPFVPEPTSKIVQTPTPARLGSTVKFTREYTDFPVDAITARSHWFINEEASGDGDDVSTTASKEIFGVRNNSFITKEGFDETLVMADFVPDVILKEWPSVVLNLEPARTTIPWGEFLISGYDVVGEEIMDDLAKLVEYKPTWYLDDEVIETLAGDGSLSIRATHPGAHVIKAVVLLTHPDYENGQLTVEKSFNMTTEPREMAITLELLPVDAVIGVGSSQKFTAVVTGAPVDATTTFVWTVDGTPQTSVQSTLDYLASTEGAKVIKVVATTKAQDAEDDVQEKTVTLTVKKVISNATVTIVAEKNPVKVGETYKLNYTVTGIPGSGVSITNEWETGENTKSISGVADTAGQKTFKVTLHITGADYMPADVVSDEYILVVEEDNVIPAECPILYVHPLPQRMSAYIWAGWWVMDAIQKMTVEGKDWKTAKAEDTPYYCHLATLAQMLVDYPEVDVQESRHGYIVHRSALEVGIIY